MNNEWIEKLQPGDKVIIAGGNSWTPNVVRKIERLTKTQIIIKGEGARFRRDNGRQCGDHMYSTKRLINPDQENLEEIMRDEKRRKELHFLNNVKWNELPDDLLQKVTNLVILHSLEDH